MKPCRKAFFSGDEPTFKLVYLLGEEKASRAMEDTSTSVQQNHLSALTKKSARVKCALSTTPATSSAFCLPSMR